MTLVRTLLPVVLTVLFFAINPHSAVAQDTPEDHLSSARDLYEIAMEATGEERGRLFREVQQKLDRIVEVFPQSDIAIDILFRRPINRLDVAVVSTEIRKVRTERALALQSRISAATAGHEVGEGHGDPESQVLPGELASVGATTGEEDAEPAEKDKIAALAPPSVSSSERPAQLDPSAKNSQPAIGGGAGGSVEKDVIDGDVAEPLPAASPFLQETPSVNFHDANSQTEASLNLDRKAIREIQSRLTSLGLDPKGVDGVVGPGTRAALRDWQEANGFPPGGFLNARQLASLRAGSQNQLDLWLRDPSNERRYSPPAPVPLTPARMAGTWNYTARCGPESRMPNQTFTGSITVRHAGGNLYKGTARDNEGLKGRFTGRLDGRVLHDEINWGFLHGRVRGTGRISDDAKTLKGRDSNGCRTTARKR